MKALVAFYSRTGNTKKVAEDISKVLKCDIEEIFDTKNRQGAIGWIFAGGDSTMKKLTKLKPVKRNPAKYDIVIIGTPVWAFTMSAPIRTYISENRNKFKKIALFCTHEGAPRNTLEDMEKFCGNVYVGSFEFNKNHIRDKKYMQQINRFANVIKKSIIDHN